MQWCFGGTTDGLTDLRQSIREAMDRVHSATQINVADPQDCFSTVDVRWHEDGNLGNRVLGSSICVEKFSPSRCHSSTIRINLDAHVFVAHNAGGGSDGNQEEGEIAFNRDISTCHELGHSVGLVHHDWGWYDTYDNDCMISPWLEIHLADNGWRKYNAHHVGHINSWSY